MPESEPVAVEPERKFVSFWVPLRTNDLGEPVQKEYGLIFWRPAIIPFGNHLEIDVAGTNRLLGLFRLSRPLEIIPYSEPAKREPLPITGVSARGEAVASRMAQRIKKPPAGQIIFDDRLGHPGVAVGFAPIAEYLEKKLVNGTNNPHFFEKYGQQVNRAFISLLGKSIKAHFGLLRKENREAIESEIWAARIGALSFSLSAFLSLVNDLGSGRRFTPAEISGIAFWATLVGYWAWSTAEALAANSPFGVSFTSFASSGKYKEYLQQFGYSEQFYPRTLVQFWLVPLLHYLTWNRPLMRGK